MDRQMSLTLKKPVQLLSFLVGILSVPLESPGRVHVDTHDRARVRGWGRGSRGVLHIKSHGTTEHIVFPRYGFWELYA